MIKASELRIGNYITDTTQEILKVSSVSEGSCNVEGRVSYHFEDTISGIPLTPEILEQCGFKPRADTGLWNGGNDFFLHHYRATDDYCFRFNDYKSYPIKYLHQLQNMYVLLTGEELQVNISQLLTN